MIWGGKKFAAEEDWIKLTEAKESKDEKPGRTQKKQAMQADTATKDPTRTY